MATTHRTKLNRLYTRLAPGTPLTSEDLAALGISADLAVHYVRAGWLQAAGARRLLPAERSARLAPEPRAAAAATSTDCMSAASRRSTGTAYANTCPNGLSYIFTAGRPGAFPSGSPSASRPSTTASGCSTSSPNALLHVRPFENRNGAPLVSAPERALLEVLSEVGVRQPLQEARELVESTYSLRADVLRDLLKRCTSVKTVRLCLQLGRELSQPWAGKLDPSQLPKGSDRAVGVAFRLTGLLVLKP